MGSRKLSRHLEEGVSAMAKTERAILSCPVEPEDLDDPLLPQPPAGVDRVEYEVELHSMVQVHFSWDLLILVSSNAAFSRPLRSFH